MVVCSSANEGVVKIDEDILTDFDMIFEDSPLISSVIYGPEIQLSVYSKDAFEGVGTLLEEPKDGTVLSLELVKDKNSPAGSTVTMNDNIRSIEFMSGSHELNKCEEAMQVYYFSDFHRKTSASSLNTLDTKKSVRRSLRGSNSTLSL